jgi:hypothetical protein
MLTSSIVTVAGRGLSSLKTTPLCSLPISFHYIQTFGSTFCLRMCVRVCAVSISSQKFASFLYQVVRISLP